jgi:hypothetical protein
VVHWPLTRERAMEVLSAIVAAPVTLEEQGWCQAA